MERIDGRKVDFLYSKDRGKICSANLSNVVKKIPNAIKKVQFVQDNVDEIVIKIVIDENKYRFGNNIRFIIDKVDFIERETSGKYRYIKNNLKEEELK